MPRVVRHDRAGARVRESDSRVHVILKRVQGAGGMHCCGWALKHYYNERGNELTQYLSATVSSTRKDSSLSVAMTRPQVPTTIVFLGPRS